MKLFLIPQEGGDVVREITLEELAGIVALPPGEKPAAVAIATDWGPWHEVQVGVDKTATTRFLTDDALIFDFHLELTDDGRCMRSKTNKGAWRPLRTRR